jgi:BolA family transcriptional regulator, general stress-responsive regulator
VDFMGAVADSIHAKLVAAFAPERIDLTDDSDKHAGHAGARDGGESHFSVAVVSAAFAHKTRVERQHMVHKALEQELAGPVHALSVTALAPGEGA